jgi:TRAP-type transport system small permease protein
VHEPTGHAPPAGDGGGGRGSLDRLFEAYLALSRTIAIVVSIGMFGLMVAVNGIEIVGRGYFATSFAWVQEVSILAAMWIYFFAYALIAKNDEYIRVDLFANALPSRARYGVEIFARLVTIAFHGTVFWFAVETYRFLGLFTTSVLDWPESLFVLPLMLGAADIVLTELVHLYWQVAGRRWPAQLGMPATME